MSELVVDIVKEGDKFYPICPCCRNKLKYVYQRMCLKCGQILSWYVYYFLYLEDI